MSSFFTKPFYLKGQFLKLGFAVLAKLTKGNIAPISSVAAIIERNHHLLLVNRSDGLGYCLPGGMMHWKETTKGALRREVKEETGITVEVQGVFNIYSGPHRDPRINAVCMVYLGQYLFGDLQESSEGVPMWVPCYELHGLRFAFDHEEVVHDYRKYFVQQLFMQCKPIFYPTCICEK